MSNHLRDFPRPDEQVANAVQTCLKQQLKILIVGTKNGNLPDWADKHPSVLQWASEGTEVERATAIPSGVGMVLFLRWVGHRQHQRIHNFARVTHYADHAVYSHPELLGTGEVRRLLAPLSPGPGRPRRPVEAAPTPAPTAEPETVSVPAPEAAGATTEAAVDSSITELLRMLDDAVATLGLAREQLVALSATNAVLRTSRAALRDKMLSLFEGA